MTTGLALGGGGAKGYAHLGALRAMLDARIDVDLWCGTSIGAIAGAAGAAGALDPMIEHVSRIEVMDIPGLLTPDWPSRGMFSGRRLIRLMSEILPSENIEDLPEPFAAVAVDLVRSQRVVLDRGPLRLALRASSSIPVLFKPVESGDLVLVDGALIDPLPITVVKDMGATQTVAIDLFADRVDHAFVRKESRLRQQLRELVPWMDEDEHEMNYDLIDVATESLATIQRQLTRQSTRQCANDCLILTPPVGHIGLLDFHKGEEAIELGFQWFKKQRPVVERFLEGR